MKTKFESLAIAICQGLYLFSNPFYIDFLKFSIHYGNTGYGVSSPRIQNLGFDLKMNEFKENFSMFTNGMIAWFQKNLLLTETLHLYSN